MRSLGHIHGLVVTAVALAAIGSGCTRSHGLARRLLGPDPTDLAATPDGAVRLVQWCWARLDDLSYGDAFTTDFQFVFGTLDPYGNAYRDTPWTRDDELASFTHLVRGGANRPTATQITLLFDSSLQVEDDPRYPAGNRWHKRIRTSAILRLADPINMEAMGFASFFLVRGDSATIPAERAARGVTPDSTRWYVSRWEDETFSESAARAMPIQKVSWGSIKALYLSGYPVAVPATRRAAAGRGAGGDAPRPGML